MNEHAPNGNSAPPPRPLDAVKGSWVDQMPAGAQPYLRLARFDRPIGTWLLLWPCWWSIALAMSEWKHLFWFPVFFIGAVAMRGAGCVLNDIVDRKIDAQVERTRHRPLASGALSLTRAVLFMAALSFVGLLKLLLMNPFAIGLGMASLILVAIYPFMKRITDWPQFVLGLTFNWGALLGWAAITGGLGLPALALYAGGIFWTLGYDTIYAHQDKADDAIVGVRSTALRLGAATRRWLVGFYGLALASFALAGWMQGLHPVFYGGLTLVAAHFAYQILRLNIDDPDRCLRLFRSNFGAGALIFAAIAAARLVERI
jgi:4-hydroxybenzoate polyprenyltransferase